MEFNLTNLTMSEQYIIPSNQKYYLEDLCQPFIQNLNKIYLTVAIYNIFYSFVWLWLKNRKDKILFQFDIDGDGKGFNFIFKISHIIMMLDTIFFLLNFFIVGYWLLLNNVESVINFPLVKWFT